MADRLALALDERGAVLAGMGIAELPEYVVRDELRSGELIEVFLELRGMVIVSGYDSELYSGMLGDWRREETDSRIAAGRGTKVRREVAWINPACADALERVPGGLWA